jgi:uncharacterized membrane protein
MRAARIREYLASSLWFIPVLCVLVGGALSFGTIAIDRAFGYEAIPSSAIGDPPAVIAILSTIAASMVSLTALVLTITMVVVQLAMGQFSPRIVQRILRDRPSQLAIGLFVATFVHAILALREVSTGENGPVQVPGVAVVTALVLVLVSIAVLVSYVHHIGMALRVSSLIELVGSNTRASIEKRYPADVADVRSGAADVIASGVSGVVVAVAHDPIVEEASKAGCTVELVPAVGEFVPADAPLFRIRGDRTRLDEDRLRTAVALDEERKLDGDVSYGIRMLVDIAERTLAASPFLDPTTAVQAIDRLHDILRQLARRPLPDGRYYDANGELRLVMREMTWDAYVHLAFDEIRLAGAGSPQVSRRLVAALTDLQSIVPPERLDVVEYELAQLSQVVGAAHADEHDRTFAMLADNKGIGESVDGGGTSEQQRQSGHD